MRFSDKKKEFVNAVESMALMLSIGAIFLQIWILFSAIESYFKAQYENILPSLILSAIAFLACGVSVLLTYVNFFKGMGEGRSHTYQKKSS